MKKDRQEKIAELISSRTVETQEELVRLLLKSGYDVTQATISRDIREMKLTKVPGKSGRSCYALLPESENELSEKYVRVLREGMTTMGEADCILVVRTIPGMASAVAAALDAMQMEDIVGTIAGDDTIMLAVTSREASVHVMDKIREVLH